MPQTQPVDRRSFIGATVAATMAGLAGCSAVSSEAEMQPSEASEWWPAAEDGQCEVLLVGTYHFAGSETDVSSFETDPLDEDQQRQLDELTDRFVEWEPDTIAVEMPPNAQGAVDNAYEAWQNNDLDSVPETADGESIGKKSEIVQVGARLGDKLDHDSLLAVDHKLPLTDLNSSLQALPSPDSASYPLPEFQTKTAEIQQQLAERSQIEYFRYLNEPAQRRLNDQLLLTAAMEGSAVGDYAEQMVTWYQRNLRIAANLWNRIEDDTDRVLLLFGVSHIPLLRNICNLAPMFTPVSPLPFLES